MASKRFSLNEKDIKAWVKSALEWAAPLGLIYFSFAGLNLQDGFSVNDFVPSNAVIGALALYIVNQLYGLSKRFSSGK